MKIPSQENTGFLIKPAAVGQAGPKADIKLKQACRDFEAIFISYMLKKMRQTVSESKLIFGGRGEEIFRDMQDEEIAKDMSQAQGIGLSGMLYDELSRQGKLRQLSVEGGG